VTPKERLEEAAFKDQGLEVDTEQPNTYLFCTCCKKRLRTKWSRLSAHCEGKVHKANLEDAVRAVAGQKEIETVVQQRMVGSVGSTLPATVLAKRYNLATVLTKWHIAKNKIFPKMQRGPSHNTSSLTAQCTLCLCQPATSLLDCSVTRSAALLVVIVF
jgi:hypothetical protein